MTEKERLELLREANRLRVEAKKIIEDISKGDLARAAAERKSNEEYKKKIELIKEINTQIKEEQDLKKHAHEQQNNINKANSANIF